MFLYGCVLSYILILVLLSATIAGTVSDQENCSPKTQYNASATEGLVGKLMFRIADTDKLLSVIWGWGCRSNGSAMIMQRIDGEPRDDCIPQPCRYKMDKDYNLVISDVKASDAGAYWTEASLISWHVYLRYPFLK